MATFETSDGLGLSGWFFAASGPSPRVDYRGYGGNPGAPSENELTLDGRAARRIPRAIWPVIQRKLDQIDSVARLDDLRVPPGNRLHPLVDELAGSHAIRVNDQYRDVRCTDYH